MEGGEVEVLCKAKRPGDYELYEFSTLPVIIPKELQAYDLQLFGGEDEIINLLVGNTHIVSKTISITALYADTLKLKIF